ncbi:hypothetical protein [Pantoea piersonii]|jgi:hypothetical protein|uniref:hypothetical protein n=1 Tax=Pantoea piersonii TaxID=2364647 RepID=UPI0011C3D5F6|nr:hypothetical protein [Pantoea piersonii]MBZ6385162.1 hypothetical protein [Pantoea piersonii]MBZ6385238.1 hypothetical protein [Pantoea piersonii]MBZ6398690.1 hypothetical protein [Pantoea piersonii]MBZ6398766.1 hypothetical protein [Pantoea piersonii]MBZ6406620.1 hypothetical protein [Pantoea piersonii]
MNDETYVYAVICKETNLVINRIDWDGVQKWAPPEGCIAVRVDDPTAGGIGDSYNPDDGEFT